MKNKNEVKRQEAQARQEGAAKMTSMERLAALDVRLGKGAGAARERARLFATLTEEQKAAYEDAAKATKKSAKKA